MYNRTATTLLSETQPHLVSKWLFWNCESVFTMNLLLEPQMFQNTYAPLIDLKVIFHIFHRDSWFLHLNGTVQPKLKYIFSLLHVVHYILLECCLSFWNIVSRDIYPLSNRLELDDTLVLLWASDARVKCKCQECPPQLSCKVDYFC